MMHDGASLCTCRTWCRGKSQNRICRRQFYGNLHFNRQVYCPSSCTTTTSSHTMPNSRRYLQRNIYFPIQQLPLEQVLEVRTTECTFFLFTCLNGLQIFTWCSPLEFVVLRCVSRKFKVILDTHGRQCWTQARANFLCMPAPPSLPVNSP